MRKSSLSVRMLVLLSLLALAAACGGGGGGGGGAAPLATGLFTKTTATVSSGANGTGLMSGSNSYTHWQHLYLATAVKGSGKITGLAFKYGGIMSSAVTCTGTTIKLGHTTLNVVTSTFATNVSNGKGGQTTVLSDGTLSFPAGAVGTWQTVTFTTPFDYNGVDNLVVDVERTAACSGDVKEEWHSDSYNGTTWSFTPAAATGSVGNFITNTKFTFAGGDNKQEYGGTGNNTWPFHADDIPGSGAPLRTQNLYLASNINGSGPITGIGFQMNATSVAGRYTYSLTLGHSTLSALTTTFADNYSSTPVTVASAMTFTIPAGIPAGEWIWVPIPNSVFTYNGIDNLIVDVATTSGTANNALRTTTIAGSRVAGSSATAATGDVDSSEYHIALRFNGGKMMVLPNVSEGASGQVLGAGAAGQIQSMYQNTLLGTSGTINNVYVRLRSSSTPTAASLTNYKLYMGHTTKSALNPADTYASNMDGMATVFNGTLTVPAGVKAGDWVKIPLNQGFLYDSSKNLTILFTADAGPLDNVVSVLFDATRFPINTVGRNDNSVSTSGLPAWTFDGIVDLAVDISK